MARCIPSFILVVLAVSSVAHGGTVEVTDYSWLQLKPDRVSISLESVNTGNLTGYRSKDRIRWGSWLWIPNHNMTGAGSADWAVIVELDQPRLVETVRTQWWANEGTSLDRYYVYGSLTGAAGDWTQIGVDDAGSTIQNTTNHTRPLLDVDDGTWQYIKVEVRAGDFTAGPSSSRGGPGLQIIQPFGSGPVDETEVNWAHKATFGTSTDRSGTLDYRTFNFNDGDMRNAGDRVGDSGDWEPGEYARVDLTEKRFIDTLVIDWNDGWEGDAFDLQWSNDGQTFHTVTFDTGPTKLGGDAATVATFEPIFARHWQVTNV